MLFNLAASQAPSMQWQAPGTGRLAVATAHGLLTGKKCSKSYSVNPWRVDLWPILTFSNFNLEGGLAN